MDLIAPCQYLDHIDKTIISQAIDFYESQTSFDTKIMKKCHPGPFPDIIKPYIEEILNKKLIYCAGNFYSHNLPYFPHTDYKKYLNNHINVVIPLSYQGELPHLVVFDQIWSYDSVTWCMHCPVYKFECNTGVKGCPYEYPVENLTYYVDTKLHEKYLNHFPSHCLFGLTGNVYPYIPSSIIIFDNRLIHCTANWSGHKTGLSLRFTTV